MIPSCGTIFQHGALSSSGGGKGGLGGIEFRPNGCLPGALASRLRCPKVFQLYQDYLKTFKYSLTVEILAGNQGTYMTNVSR